MCTCAYVHGVCVCTCTCVYVHVCVCVHVHACGCMCVLCMVHVCGTCMHVHVCVCVCVHVGMYRERAPISRSITGWQSQPRNVLKLHCTCVKDSSNIVSLEITTLMCWGKEFDWGDIVT